MDTVSCTGARNSTKGVQSRSVSKDAVPDSSSKEKKILPGRRQQRHSTEIGAEYHRWWAVRNAVGFETNEHIAGLLLDGFHALLEQIVFMCGGPAYHPKPEQNKKSSADSVNQGGATSSTSGGAEEDEEFTEYKNAIMFYCDTLWQMCGQQDSRLQELDKASQPMQDFIIRLMGYLKVAKGRGFSLNYKKKRFKQSSSSNSGAKERELFPTPSSSSQGPSFVGGQSMAAGNIQLSNPAVQFVPTSSAVFSKPHQQPWLHGRLAYVPNSGSYAFTPTSGSSVDGTKEQAEKEIQALRDCNNMQSCAITHSGRHIDNTLYNLIPGANPVGYSKENCVGNSFPSCLTEQEFDGEEQSWQRQIRSSSKRKDANFADLPQVKSELVFTGSEKSVCTGDVCSPPLPPCFEEPDSSSYHASDFPSQKSLPMCGPANEISENTWREEVQSGQQQQPPSTSDILEGSLKSLLKKPVNLNSYSQRKCHENNQAAGDADQMKGKQESLRSSGHRVVLTEDVHSSAQYGKKLESAVQKLSKLTTDKESTCRSNVKVEKYSKSTNTAYSNEVKMDSQASARDSRIESELSSEKSSKAEVRGGNTSHKMASSEHLLPIQPALCPQGLSAPSLTTSLGTPVFFYPAQSLNSRDSSLASLSSLVQNIVYNSHSTVFKSLSVVPGMTMSSSVASQAVVSQLSLSQDNNSTKTVTSVPIFSTHISNSSYKPTLLPLYISPAGVGALSLAKPGMKSVLTQPSALKLVQPTTVPLVQTLDGSEVKMEATSMSQVINLCGADELKITDVRSCAEEDFLSADYMKGFEEVQCNKLLSSGDACPDYSECHGLSGKKLEFDSLSSDESHPTLSQRRTDEKNTGPGPGNAIATEGRPGCKHGNVLNSKVLSQLPHSQALESLKSAFLEKTKNTATSLKGEETQKITGSSFSSQEKGCSDSKNVVRSKLNSSSSNTKTPHWRRLACSSCQLIFFSGTDLLVHRYEQHSHVCGECDGRFLSRARLEQHKAADHPEIILCQRCRFHTFSKSVMDDHLRDVHDLAPETEEKKSKERSDENPAQTESSCERTTGQGENDSQKANTDGVSEKCEGPLTVEGRSVGTGNVNECRSGGDKLTDEPFRPHTVSRDAAQDYGNGSRPQDNGSSLRGKEGTKRKLKEDNMGDFAEWGKNCSSGNASGQSLVSKDGLLPNQGQPCPGPVFPSFSHQPAARLSPRSAACDPVSSMYSQVMQHCLLDAPPSFLHISDPQSQLQDFSDPKHERSPKSQVSLLLDLSEPRELQQTHMVDSQPLQQQQQQQQQTQQQQQQQQQTQQQQQQQTQQQQQQQQQTQQQQQQEQEQFSLEMNEQREQLSECDEPPQLVIDTGEQPSGREENFFNNTCRQADVGQGRSEQEAAASWHQDQPLCLVVHNRQHTMAAGDGKNSSNSPKDNTSEDWKAFSSLLSVDQPPLDLSMLDQGVSYVCPPDSGSVVNTSAPVQSFMQTSEYSQATYPFREDVSTNRYGVCESAPGIDAKKKLVMKISLKRSAVGSPPEEAPRKKRKRKRRRKTRVVSESLVDTTAVDIDNPEVDDEGNCVLLDATMDSALCRHGVESFAEFDSLRRDVSETEENPRSSNVNVSHVALDGSSCNDLGVAGKVLSLRERHRMSSLPPKKRNFRKSPRGHAKNEEMVPNAADAVNPTLVTDDKSFPDMERGTVHKSSTGRSARSQATAEGQRKCSGKELRSHGRKSSTSSDSAQQVTAYPRTNEGDYGLVEESTEFSGKDGSECVVSQSSQRTGRYACPVLNCSATFSRKWSMDMHINKVHSGVLSCTVSGCREKFASRRDLRQHVTTEHKGKTRKYLCSWPGCSKSFYAQTHLQVHNLTHTGEKPVACQICDYRCRQRTALLWHMRKHGIFQSGGPESPSTARSVSLRAHRNKSAGRDHTPASVV
ncbi:uncharacterized protein LOC101852610 [Aplysia californica]|uniref:Uncharacterized protein LOC101852610 n=1 Tax=Aplysia californica TaxID=6500 RepID=A0ABM0ZVX7_APLCA|nr:uncharacterized protein LOC101852610 [Aplysia californica]